MKLSEPELKIANIKIRFIATNETGYCMMRLENADFVVMQINAEQKYVNQLAKEYMVIANNILPRFRRNPRFISLDDLETLIEFCEREISTYKDITIYRKNEKNEQPRCFLNEVNGVRFRVHKHPYAENEWALSCYEFDVENVILHATDAETAKKNAIKEMIQLLDNRIWRYKAARKELKDSTEN